MGTLTVREYKFLGKDPRASQKTGGSFAQMVVEPAITSQTVTTGGVSAATSNALNDDTSIVRLSTDTTCYVRFAASPTAVAGDLMLFAGVPEYFGVIPGTSLKVAAIDK